MRLLLINANTYDRYIGRWPIRPMPLGLAYLLAALDPLGDPAAARKRGGAGCAARVLDLMFADDPRAAVVSTVREFQPQAIAFSIRNLDNQSPTEPLSFLPAAREIVETCRQLSAAPIIVGGPAFSVLPEACFRYLRPDLGIIGDGETTFPRLLEGLARGEVPNDLPGLVREAGGRIVANPGQGLSDFRRIPLRSALDIRRYAAAGFGVGVVTKMRAFPRPGDPPPLQAAARALRIRPVPEVVAEVRELREAFDVGRIFFLDPGFEIPLEYAKDLCRALAEALPGLQWSAALGEGRLDEELAGLMARSGCAMALLGGIGPMQDEIRDYRRHLEALRERCRLLGRAGVPFMVSVIFGRPGETRETVEDALGLLEEIRPDQVNLVAGVRVFPGTPLADRARREGHIRAEEDLLFPTFYVSAEVSPWLLPRLREVAPRHPAWAIV